MIERDNFYTSLYIVFKEMLQSIPLIFVGRESTTTQSRKKNPYLLVSVGKWLLASGNFVSPLA